MSALAYYFTQQDQENEQQEDPVNPNIYRLFYDIGSTDKHYHVVAKSLELVNEPFIEEYIRNTIGPTHGFGLQHVETFAINRPEDRIEFMDHIGDRRLLWHGTKRQNVYKILRDGFNLGLAKKSGMFGPGIYTSDCVTKAVNYADRGYNPCKSCSYSYLFLCEVALGKIRACKSAYYNARENLGTANSVWGQGYYQSSVAKYWSDSKDTIMICPGPMENPISSTGRNSLDYNEYIVYNTFQIRLRYLVKVRHTPLRYRAPIPSTDVYPMYQRSLYPEKQIETKPYKPQHEHEISASSSIYTNPPGYASFLTMPPPPNANQLINNIGATRTAWQQNYNYFPPTIQQSTSSSRFPAIPPPLTNNSYSFLPPINKHVMNWLGSVMPTNFAGPSVYYNPLNTAPSNQAPMNTAPSNQAPMNTAPSNQAPLNTAPSNQAQTNTAPSNQAQTKQNINQMSTIMAPTNQAPLSTTQMNPAPPTYASNAAPTKLKLTVTQKPQPKNLNTSVTQQSKKNTLKYVFRSTNNPSQPYTISPANNPATLQPFYSFNNMIPPPTNSLTVQNPPQPTYQPSNLATNSTQTMSGTAKNPIVLLDDFANAPGGNAPVQSTNQQSTQKQASNEIDDLFPFLIDSTLTAKPAKQPVAKPVKKVISALPSKKSNIKTPLSKKPITKATKKKVSWKVESGSCENPIFIA